MPAMTILIGVMVTVLPAFPYERNEEFIRIIGALNRRSVVGEGEASRPTAQLVESSPSASPTMSAAVSSP